MDDGYFSSLSYFFFDMLFLVPEGLEPSSVLEIIKAWSFHVENSATI